MGTPDDEERHMDYAWEQRQAQAVAPQPPPPWNQGKRDYGVVNFYRINEPRNSSMVKEPLDELRIKVAKWLYN